MESIAELLSEIECPFKPLMAQGDGSPMGRSTPRSRSRSNSASRDLIRFDESANRSQGPIGDESFEAIGGNSSVIDPCDLKSEIAQLKYQIHNLTEECSDLKLQNSAFQDENIQLLSEKEDAERKLAGRDLAQERIKQLQRQFDEAVRNVSNIEDLNSILRTKNLRLEKDCEKLIERNKTLSKDYNHSVAELDRAFVKLKQKEEEINRIKSASEDLIEKWTSKLKLMENNVTDLHETLEEITRSNLQLRKEKYELENNLVDLAGNQLVHLNSSTCSLDDNFSRSSSISPPSSSSGTQYSTPQTPQSYLGRSLHAEIAATIERKRSIKVIQLQTPPSIPFHQMNSDNVDAFTQSEIREESYGEGFWDGERRHVECNQDLDQILILLRELRTMIFKRSVEEEVVDLVVGRTTENGDSFKGETTGDTPDLAVPSSSGHQDEMVRRINEELTEFRQQLKKSQELFHAMQTNGSVSAVSLGNVTQSCPILVEPETIQTKKPILVTCSTQTDPASTVMGLQSRRSSSQQDAPVRSLLDAIDDDADADCNYLDKLSDDISYRLTINLPTVLEESEQETEISPGAGPRRMSSIEGGRRNKARLTRSTNAHEEDITLNPNLNLNNLGESFPNNHPRSNSSRGDDVVSSDEFKSAATSISSGSVNSSAFNSMERPLQVKDAYGHRNGNGDSDSVSIVSDGTFGSPLSYPSSPTYWTPGEGSSSQETITNIDGDKTPVNDGFGPLDERLEVVSCPIPSHRTEYENGNSSLRQRGSGRSSSSCGPTLPFMLPNETVGVIPESHREHMIKYAYDVPRRSTEPEAKLLTGEEWRTLKADLDKNDQENYRKRFAQEEGNDIEGGLAVESGSQRPLNAPDLEEEAEECLEKFPGLVEKLFADLDVLKGTQKSPAEFDLEIISTRFNHLAHTFKVEHCNLTQRKDINLTNHEHATTKVENIIESVSDIVQKFQDITNKTKVPEDIGQLILSLTHIPGDLDIYTHELSKTSRRVGMMDVQVRLYKMIEVMVLYVHILRNLCAEKDKDIQNARKLLEKHSIPFSRTKAVSTMNNNNNNNEKVSWDEGQVDDVGLDGQPKQLLQHLLGPKKSNIDLEFKLREKLVLNEEKSSNNPIIRFLSDAYETIRCELFWPWTWDDTWRGMKQGFTFILMIIGLIVIVRSLFPIVSADDPPPVSDLGSIFSKHGKLHHPALPPI